MLSHQTDKLERAIDRLVAAMQPEAIYLFGSHARDEAGPDSDYDLLVILPDDAPATRRSLRAIAEIPRDPRVPLDIVPCRRSVLESKRDRVGTLSYQVTHEERASGEQRGSPFGRVGFSAKYGSRISHWGERR